MESWDACSYLTSSSGNWRVDLRYTDSRRARTTIDSLTFTQATAYDGQHAAIGSMLSNRAFAINTDAVEVSGAVSFYGGVVLNYRLAIKAGPLVEEDFGFPDGTAAASSSAYATKGEFFKCRGNFDITSVWVNNAVSTAFSSEVVVATMSSATVSGTITAILGRKTFTNSLGISEIVLDTAASVSDGDILFIGQTRKGGSGTTNVEIRFYNGHYRATRYAENYSTLGGARFTDNDLQIGDSPANISTGRWGVTFTSLQ